MNRDQKDDRAAAKWVKGAAPDDDYLAEPDAGAHRRKTAISVAMTIEEYRAAEEAQAVAAEARATAPPAPAAQPLATEIESDAAPLPRRGRGARFLATRLVDEREAEHIEAEQLEGDPRLQLSAEDEIRDEEYAPGRYDAIGEDGPDEVYACDVTAALAQDERRRRESVRRGEWDADHTRPVGDDREAVNLTEGRVGHWESLGDSTPDAAELLAYQLEQERRYRWDLGREDEDEDEEQPTTDEARATCGNPNGECPNPIRAKERCGTCLQYRNDPRHRGEERPLRLLNRGRRRKAS